MTSTFLGKWRLYLSKPKVPNFASEGYAAYTPEPHSQKNVPVGLFCMWYVNNPAGGPYPPGKETNIAFIASDQSERGEFRILLNNGQYVTAREDNRLGFTSELEEAVYFSFMTPELPPESFTGRMIMIGTDGFTWIGDDPNAGGFLVNGLSVNEGPMFEVSQVTPTLESFLEGDKGDGLDFAWVDLTGAVLKGVSCLHADFSNCNLTDATFTAVDFSGAVLTNAHLTGAKLQNVFLIQADFSNCNLTKATFTNVYLTDAILDNADLTGATCLNAVRLHGATFKGTILSQTSLAGAVFKQADLTSVIANPRPRFYNTPLQPPSPTNPRTSLAGCSLKQSLIANDWSMLDLTGATILDLSSPLSSAAKPLIAKYAILNGLNNNNLVGLTLQNAVFDYAVLDGLGLNSSDQSTSDLTSASFIQASMHGTNLTGAILKGANMTEAQLGSLSGAFTGASLNGTDLSYATLDGASFADASLHGADLSNASLKGANLTNAQLGALSSLFSVGSGTPNYAPFLKALQSSNASTVITVFGANGYTLAGQVTITASGFSSTTWTVEATAPTPVSYTVVQHHTGGVDTLDVYLPTTPAVLSNAFMVNVNFTGANLIGVNASGASIYGIAGSKPNLNYALLQEAHFANANLGNADFSSAYLEGVSFDYAVLTNAVFQDAHLITSAGGVRPSLIGANLQNANFDGATLDNVLFTNAAFGVANPNDATTAAGVWLFSLSQAQQTLVSGELQNASAHQFSLSLQSLQQLKTQGPVGPGIVAQFRKAGIALTADAVLAIMSDSIYWQLTDGTSKYVIFYSYDSENIQPALGVAAGTDYTPNPQFTLPLSLQGDLNNGPVDAAVVAAFNATGHPISKSAQITVAQHPTDWQIINGQPGCEEYSLWLDLSGGTTTITARPTLTNVIAAFDNASIALSIRATATAIKSGGWQVSNDSENPYNPVKNYIIFNVIPNSTTNGLDVFGAFMRIERLKTPTESEYFNLPAGLTKLTQKQMQSPGIVCPNGELSTTNQRNGLAYNLWLRARVAPRPPFCVPDPLGLYFCPR